MTSERGGINGLALSARRDFAVIADADASLLAPDVGPPGTQRRRTDHGAIFGEGLLVGRVRGLAELAVEFVLIGVGNELVEQLVGGGEFKDAFSGQQSPQSPILR